jgi:hypothetical protein
VSSSSASSEAILNFPKDLEALLMLFLQTIIINLVSTKSSGPKRNAAALTMPIFAHMSHTSQWGSSFPSTPGRTRPHPDFSLQNLSLMAVGRFAHGFVGNPAHRL